MSPDLCEDAAVRYRSPAYSVTAHRPIGDNSRRLDASPVLSEKSAVRYPTPTYGTMTRRPIEGAMPNIFPLQFLLATCSGWVNRQQGQAIAYLMARLPTLARRLDCCH